MTSPLPFDINIPEIITPEGRAAYLDPYRGTYRTDITPTYAQRLQRGFRRGQTLTQARRGAAAPPAGLSEREQRKQIFQNNYGISLSYWERLRRRYVGEINRRSAPGAQITPQMIADTLASGRDEQWVEEHLANRLEATIQYQDYGNPQLGRYFYDQDVYDREDAPWGEFWYYH